MKRYFILLIIPLMSASCGSETGDIGHNESDVVNPFAAQAPTGFQSVPGVGVASDAREADPMRAVTEGYAGEDTQDGVQGADGEAGESDAETEECFPKCAGKTCGEDGCGGFCGTCPVNATCTEGLCINDAFELCEESEGDYVGQFTGSIQASATGLPSFNLAVEGVIVANMECQSLDGSLSGTWSGGLTGTVVTFPMSGSVDFSKKKVTFLLGESPIVAIGGQVEYTAGGGGESTEQNGKQWEGTWAIESTDAKSIGGILDPASIQPLSGSGTWIMGPEIDE